MLYLIKHVLVRRLWWYFGRKHVHVLQTDF